MVGWMGRWALVENPFVRTLGWAFYIETQRFKV